MATRKDSAVKNRAPRRTGVEYRFKIDVYTPETMPMARLAEYMGELAAILGEPAAVHFARLERGSTILVHEIEREAAPKVRARVVAVRRGEAPPDALRAFTAVNRMLRQDDGVGTLREKSAVILPFPGRDDVPEKYPPVRQHGTIEGVVVGIGGADKTVHVRLMVEDRQVSGYWTDRRTAKELAHHLYEPVRLSGRGKWTRNDEGDWNLQTFKIEGFEPLRSASLSEALAEIRNLPFRLDAGAYDELDIVRHGPPRKVNGGH